MQTSISFSDARSQKVERTGKSEWGVALCFFVKPTTKTEPPFMG
jgi:hypothetical protein